MRFRSRILIACVVGFTAALSFAQSSATGDFRITVRDEKGSLVTSATVTVRDQAKGLERTTSLNNNGEYLLRNLPPGTYTITVEAGGFAKNEAPDQVLTVGQVKELAFTLKVASAQTVLTVTSEAAVVETTQSQTTNTVDQRRIDNLPINGRNYINFALTDSQVLRDNAPNIGAAPTSGLNISGQRARSNLVNVDGVDAIDNSTDGVRSTVSQEAVQEFQIISNSYAAEYGRASGGVVNIITRSGSNDFHGDAYGYLRNRNFQATNPFSTVPNPAYTRTQAGVAIGGPIKKDKTYFYFSYEITRRRETGFSDIGTPNGTFGLVNTDVSTVYGAPPGTFVIQATPDQQTFFQNYPAVLQQLAAVNPAGAQQYAQEVAAYTTFVGGSTGVALNGTYPASFAFLPPALVPGGLKQFPSSCYAFSTSNLNLTCNGLPSSFLTLAAQVGNYPVK
jgi:hypothetical protein